MCINEMFALFRPCNFPLPNRSRGCCAALWFPNADRPALVGTALPRRHWDNWIYSKEAHHWHSLWCRWRPSGELIHACHAERIFEPTDDGNRQKNIYHFEDERAARFPKGV